MFYAFLPNFRFSGTSLGLVSGSQDPQRSLLPPGGLEGDAVGTGGAWRVLHTAAPPLGGKQSAGCPRAWGLQPASPQPPPPVPRPGAQGRSGKQDPQAWARGVEPGEGSSRARRRGSWGSPRRATAMRPHLLLDTPTPSLPGRGRATWASSGRGRLQLPRKGRQTLRPAPRSPGQAGCGAPRGEAGPAQARFQAQSPRPRHLSSLRNSDFSSHLFLGPAT